MSKLDEHQFWLRVVAVAEAIYPGEYTTNLANDRAYAGVKLCVRTGDDNEACPSMKSIAMKGGARSTRLLVKTSDVVNGRIELRMNTGRRTVTKLMARRDPITTASLCGSLSLHDNQQTMALTFYLDDVESVQPDAGAP